MCVYRLVIFLTSGRRVARAVRNFRQLQPAAGKLIAGLIRRREERKHSKAGDDDSLRHAQAESMPSEENRTMPKKGASLKGVSVVEAYCEQQSRRPSSPRFTGQSKKCCNHSSGTCRLSPIAHYLRYTKQTESS